MITQKELKELVHYDPSTGLVTWLKPRSNRVKAGDEVGFTTNWGYRRVNLKGKYILIHRLIWLYMTGDWPATTIDHKDRNRLNNRWKNLRLAPGSTNQRNCSKSKNNTTGVTGVSYMPRKKLWKAEIGHKGVSIVLGTRKDFSEAVALRRAAEAEYAYSSGHGT